MAAESGSGYLVGVDIGGTFTDAVVMTPDGVVAVGKVSTTPDDFSRGFFAGIDAAASELGLSVEELLGQADRIAHGTTVGINALVTGAVARTALITTKGHADAIRAMGGEGRILGASIEELLDYRLSSKPDPVVAPEDVFEVTERVDRDGDVVVELRDAEIERLAEAVAEDRYQAAAISLLWSFMNPAHEQALAAALSEKLPDMFISCAHEVAPRIGEYGRTVSAVFNAQIGPLMVGYIKRIVDGAAERGFGGDVLFGQAEGGLATAAEAARLPLTTLQSGPVAGVVGAALAGTRMGYPNVVVTDMGGTTLDVATITDGRVGYREESETVRQLSYLRKVDVESVGAGGGSIAWIHPETGRLRVGPQSAGAVPGPICYSRGGTEVTVTDADLVLGVLDPSRRLAGGLELDYDAAYQGIAALGETLGLDPLACAAGIVEIVDSRMEDLIRRVTVQRGQDPRSFTLWGYGGASGAHAGLYGKGIGVTEVVFPLADTASVWSAYGLPQLDRVRTFAANAFFQTPFDLDQMAVVLSGLEADARNYAEVAGLEDFTLLRRAEMKYPLQVHTVETPLPDGDIDDAWAAQLMANFNTAYEERYGPGTGFAAAGAATTAMRVTVQSATPPAPLLESANGAAPAPDRERLVYWREMGQSVSTPIFDGFACGAHADPVAGPAIVEYPHTTVVVRPGQQLRSDRYGNLVLTL